jgi:23S rRNA (cytidine1920-2'-O)/16S rRNA (cytidine1409-2'-O)-methyltransferase
VKLRLDVAAVQRGLVSSRSQAESFIRLGQVTVNGQVVSKAGALVSETDTVILTAKEQYVSRAGLKLASVAKILGLNFTDKTVLDVGSRTGGFTDYALQHGAMKVYAVDVGTDQLHPRLRGNPAIELHEKTDIRDFAQAKKGMLSIDIVVADVSFISLREILPSVALLSGPKTQIAAMVKPQFESGADYKHKGVIKNDKIRREILKDFESWLLTHSFVIQDKADSEVSGTKGNRERFYLLSKAAPTKPTKA